MSRAIDKDTINLVKNGDFSASYEAIASALDPMKYDGLIEIEILKGTHHFEPETHILQDGNAIAISKTSLVQAYFVALNILRWYFRELTDILPSTVSQKDKLPTSTRDSEHDILRATSVILLMDPEHLTAVNLRKRIITGQGLPAKVKYWPSEPPNLENLLNREKRFIDSLLTSRLHRHTKSPTLWSHRRWLLPLYRKYGLLSVLNDISKIVMVAAERHPRNYYAWHHARMLVGLGEVYDRRLLLHQVVDWCTRHHDDVSGWSFLAHLLSQPRGPDEEVVAIMRDVHRLARSMRWSNESVWWFLRTMAAWNTTAGSEEEFGESLRVIGALIQPRITRDGSGQRVLDAAASWCVRNRRTTLEEG